MKSKSIRYLIIACACLAVRMAPAYCETWQTETGEHFFIFYAPGDEYLSREALSQAELYYNEIAANLGYPRYSEFWTWGNRARIYMYHDQQSFLKATGQPEWSQGMADYNHKEIMGVLGNKGFLQTVLPHEMAHLIFRDFVGFKGEVPLWLDEGVAQWNEKVRREEVRTAVKALYRKDALLSMKDMMQLDVRSIKYKNYVYIRPNQTKKGEPGILFLSGDELVKTFYLQAVSVVDFLISAYGTDNFTHFCRQLRDGKTLNEALVSVYPLYDILSQADLEREWKRYLKDDLKGAKIFTEGGNNAED